MECLIFHIVGPSSEQHTYAWKYNTLFLYYNTLSVSAGTEGRHVFVQFLLLLFSLLVGFSSSN